MRDLEVNPNVLHRWRREFRQAPGIAFPGRGQRRCSEGKIAELERKIGHQANGDRFFERVLAVQRGTADAADIDWNSAVHRKVGEEVSAGGRLSIGGMVKVGGVSGAASTASGPRDTRRLYALDGASHIHIPIRLDLGPGVAAPIPSERQEGVPVAAYRA